MKKLPIKCVFFDFDGVIIENSQLLAFELFHLELKKYDFNVSVDYLREHCQGMNGERVLQQLSVLFNKKIPIAAVETTRNNYKKVIAHQAALGHNLIKLLPMLQERFICSSNHFDVITQLLSAHQIKHYFPDETIFSIDRIKHSKPAPDVYLKAIEMASTPLANCCAIEDSTTGVKAAKAAGLYTVGYVAELSMDYVTKQSAALIEAGADKILSDLATLRA